MTRSIDPSPQLPAATPVATQHALNRRLLLSALRITAITLGALTVAWTLHKFSDNSGLGLPMKAAILLAVLSTTLAVWSALQQRWRWQRPANHLNTLLDEIRRGQAPIEELSQVHGGPELLIPTLREILVELRQQKAEVAQIRGEVTQRVAQRTDALERAIGSLRAQATRDALTGLYNRRMLNDCLRHEIQSARDAARPLCVLMIDIDNFKLLNDTRGHATGDELLKIVAQLLRSSTGEGDWAFRLGGDEFVLLLPDRTPEAAQALADRLISLVDAVGRSYKLKYHPRLSVGIASADQAPPDDPDALLRTADAMLYEVKSKRHRARRVSDALDHPLRAGAA